MNSERRHRVARENRIFYELASYHLPPPERSLAPSRRCAARTATTRCRRPPARDLGRAGWRRIRQGIFDHVLRVLNDAAGQPVVLVVADDHAIVSQLEALFTEQREKEWVEFLGDCDKYEAELKDEVAKGKLALAELDEEEESPDRLRRWFRTIRARDLFRASSGSAAERRLKECADALERFAEQVCEAREQP
jgi:hypothetical protein